MSAAQLITETTPPQPTPTGHAVRHRRRRTEEAHVLDTMYLMRDGVFALGPGQEWVDRCTSPWWRSDVIYMIEGTAGELRALRVAHHNANGMPIVYNVALTATRVHFGGRQWWVADQLGHANPELTLRTYAHVVPDEETDLGFADFGTENLSARLYTSLNSEAGSANEYAPGTTDRGRYGFLERETGLEPATLGLGSRCSTN